MKRNVYQRTKQRLVDWLYGVETDEFGNPLRVNPSNTYDFDDDGDCEAADSTWSTYSILGCSPDWADDVIDTTNKFKVGQTVFVRFKTENIAAAYFHMAVFSQQTQITEGFHIAARRSTDSNHDEIFSGTVLISAEITEAFDEWFAKYSARVVDLERTLPIVREGDQISGIAVAFHGKTRRNEVPDDELFKEWLWINENCDGKVVATQKCWVFEDQTDAVKYKLTSF